MEKGQARGRSASVEELAPISRSAVLIPALPGLPRFPRGLAHSLAAAEPKKTRLKVDISFKTESFSP